MVVAGAAGRVMVEVTWTTLQVDAADVAAAEAAEEAEEAMLEASDAVAAEGARAEAAAEEEMAGMECKAGRAETNVLQAKSAAVRRLMEESMVVR